MSPSDRDHLAAAYCAAWKAVKGLPITVTVQPNGWFAINAHFRECGPRMVRASALILGLSTLTQRIADGDAAVVRNARHEA